MLEDTLSNDSDSYEQSIHNIKIEIPFSEMSHGYSTEEFENDELRYNDQMMMDMKENSSPEQQSPKTNVGKDPYNKTSLTAQSINTNLLNYNNDSNGIINSFHHKQNIDQEQLAKNIVEKIQKPIEHKPQKLKSSKEWIDNYRQQESQRYLHPTKPWSFILQDGTKTVVGPVAKKINVSLASKPRDHPLLKPDRLPYITILSLVRDAAARLPNGIGTRADICELLKESAHINEKLSQDKLSSIVSGALDRLHYMDDACVKYDLEKKVWIYLHRERLEDYPDWQDGDDNIKLESSKTKKKKKLLGNDMDSSQMMQNHRASLFD